MRSIFTNLLLIAVTLALLTHFIAIAIMRTVSIAEPVQWILYTEIAGMVAIVGFALANIANTK